MNEPLPRRVIYSASILDRIRFLAAKAKLRGIKEAFRSSLIHLQKRLQSRPLPPEDDPHVFGEPCFHTPHRKFLICQAAFAPLALSFGVGLDIQEARGERFIGVYVLTFHLMDDE